MAQIHCWMEELPQTNEAFSVVVSCSRWFWDDPDGFREIVFDLAKSKIDFAKSNIDFARSVLSKV